MKNDTTFTSDAVSNYYNGKDTDFSVQFQDPIEEKIVEQRESLRHQPYALRPITPYRSTPEATAEHRHLASGETPTQVAQEAETTATPTADMGIDFSKTDNPKQNPNVGLFTIKAANEWIDEASNRPMPCKLFGQLWFEHEICILFSDSNLGKSILAVQIADAVSRGNNAMGMAMEAQPQMVLYFDFELSDKQFEVRYIGDDGTHYQFSPNLKRVEINPDVVDYPDGCDFEEYIKISLQQAVEELGAKVIILDNITFLSRETEKAKDALPLMKWLKSFGRKYNLSILILAHTPKRNMANPITKNDLQGSKMLYNFCDGCFAIGESTQSNQLRYIKELKQRNVAFAFDADNVIVCEITKPDNFLMFRFVEYGCESEHLRQLTDNERDTMIERAKELSRQGKSEREIAKILGVKSHVTIHNWLNK